MSGIGFVGGPSGGGAQVLAQSAVAVPLTGTLVETTLATIVIPAGAMGKNGSIEVEVLVSCTNNANLKTAKVKFGAAFVPISYAFGSAAGAQLRRRIHNRGAANSQVAAGLPLSGQDGWTNFGAVQLGAEDTSQAVNLLITGTLANIADTLTLENYRVLLMPKA